MPPVIDKVFTDLDVQSGLSEAEYLEILDGTIDITAFPIFSQDGKSHVAKALATNVCSEIIQLTAISQLAEWHYAKIEDESLLWVDIIFCPPDGTQNNTLPPTSAEHLLLDAWLGGLSASAHGFSGSVLAKIYAPTIDRSIISALYGTVNCSDTVSQFNSYPSFVHNKSTARVTEKSRFLKKQIPYSRLLNKALKEADARWRFLQFYRVLEQGYLEIILSKITEGFIEDPKSTLKQAEKSITSELEQLKNLITSERLEFFFEFIFDDLEEIKNNGNKFAFRVNGKADATGGPAKHDRGAAAVYAIRCAIAHAGVRDIYYEQFPDADEAVGRILSTFEEAVFKFLGVNLDA